MSELQTIHQVKQQVEFAKSIENFMALLNKSPKPDKVKRNPYANNSQYISISEIEMEMDKLFFGRWSVKLVGQPQILGNSVVVSLEVHFFNPATQDWLCRSGVGAQDVQTDDQGRARAKALIKAVPSAKSIAFKNACKSIGKLLGRDLNRNDEADFVRTSDFLTKAINQISDEQLTKIESLIHNCTLPSEKIADIEDMAYNSDCSMQDAAKIILYLQENQKLTPEERLKRIS